MGVEEIYRNIENKYVNDVGDDNKDELYQFIINFCKCIWSVLHYDFTICPLDVLVNGGDTKYDGKIHEKEGYCRGDSIEYYIFPAIMKGNECKTKMYVICNDIE